MVMYNHEMITDTDILNHIIKENPVSSDTRRLYLSVTNVRIYNCQNF